MNSRDIIRYCHRMDQKGWVANHDGNITTKVADDQWLATPTARAKADLAESDLITVGVEGKKISGAGGVFSEFKIHQKIYELRSDVKAVVHAHPLHASAVGSAGNELLTTAIPEAVVSLGHLIPLISLALPQSDAVFSELENHVPYFDALMMAGNGVFTYGTTLEQAFLRMELVEHVAAICLKSLPLGGPKLLSEADVQTLLKKRQDAGLARPPRPISLANKE